MRARQTPTGRSCRARAPAGYCRWQLGVVAVSVGALRQRTRRGRPPNDRKSDLRPRLPAAPAVAGLGSAGERTASYEPALKCRSAFCALFVGSKSKQHAVDPATGRMFLAVRSPQRLGMNRRSNTCTCQCPSEGAWPLALAPRSFADVHKLRCDARRPRRRWLGARHRQDFRAASPHVSVQAAESFSGSLPTVGSQLTSERSTPSHRPIVIVPAVGLS